VEFGCCYPDGTGIATDALGAGTWPYAERAYTRPRACRRPGGRRRMSPVSTETAVGFERSNEP